MSEIETLDELRDLEQKHDQNLEDSVDDIAPAKACLILSCAYDSSWRADGGEDTAS